MKAGDPRLQQYLDCMLLKGWFQRLKVKVLVSEISEKALGASTQVWESEAWVKLEG